ncbi:MAG: hypothetical protein AAFQ23_15075, partial [Cyanobacteria bacterium J06623_1]
EYHFRLGEALKTLRNSQVLIIASGSATHNLRELSREAINAIPPEWVKEFAYRFSLYLAFLSNFLRSGYL